MPTKAAEKSGSLLIFYSLDSDPGEIGCAFHGAGTEIRQKEAVCKGLV